MQDSFRNLTLYYATLVGPFSIVLYSNVAVSSRGCKPGITSFYYINTDKVPGELSRENNMLSYVRTTKNIKAKMVWYFIVV